MNPASTPSPALGRAVDRLEQLAPALSQQMEYLQAENLWLRGQLQELSDRLEHTIEHLESLMEPQA